MVNGNLQTVATDKSELRAWNFNTSESRFEPTKIKFVVDGAEMYYDVEKGEWE